MTPSDSRIFIYEVIMPSQTFSQSDSIGDRTSRMLIRVPYHRMTQEMQRINRLGGKIVSITPVGTKIDTISISEVSDQEKKQPARETSLYVELGLPWWVEISTAQPQCLYYFGPFDSQTEAAIEQPGYIEDLQGEGAQGITAYIKQCQPTVLTQEW